MDAKQEIIAFAIHTQNSKTLVVNSIVLGRRLYTKIILFMVLKVSFTEIVITIVTMPCRESITYHTLPYWLVIVEILPGFRFLLLLFPHRTCPP